MKFDADIYFTDVSYGGRLFFRIMDALRLVPRPPLVVCLPVFFLAPSAMICAEYVSWSVGLRRIKYFSAQLHCSLKNRKSLSLCCAIQQSKLPTIDWSQVVSYSIRGLSRRHFTWHKERDPLCLQVTVAIFDFFQCFIRYQSMYFSKTDFMWFEFFRV